MASSTLFFLYENEFNQYWLADSDWRSTSWPACPSCAGNCPAGSCPGSSYSSTGRTAQCSPSSNHSQPHTVSCDLSKVSLSSLCRPLIGKCFPWHEEYWRVSSPSVTCAGQSEDRSHWEPDRRDQSYGHHSAEHWGPNLAPGLSIR